MKRKSWNLSSIEWRAVDDDGFAKITKISIELFGTKKLWNISAIYFENLFEFW